MGFPKIGSKVEIVSLKHNKQLHRCWKENIILFHNNDQLIGANNETIVEESDGQKWETTEPAIFYFDKRYWFNIITLFEKNDYYYYCNLSSPVTYKNQTLQYIDYDIDVIVQSNLDYQIVDQQDFKDNAETYAYSSAIKKSVDEGLHMLIDWIETEKGPFKQSFPNKWFQFINGK
ncbi:DUF402 domain-containing protein [Pseudogracilibacillus sp. SE30717A]|uniref:DUF402 domain-containing protein n=1 Tax=Pseudogracilibacillus sp. SE30717A TaxID=3098293 RepID=UPI00300E1A56